MLLKKKLISLYNDSLIKSMLHWLALGAERFIKQTTRNFEPLLTYTLKKKKKALFSILCLSDVLFNIIN